MRNSPNDLQAKGYNVFDLAFRLSRCSADNTTERARQWPARPAVISDRQHHVVNKRTQLESSSDKFEAINTVFPNTMYIVQAV